MEANTHRPSAQILSFPTGGRRTASSLSAKAKFAAEIRAIRELNIMAETGWYHQEAMDDALKGRKN